MFRGRVAVPSATAGVTDGGGTPSLPGVVRGRVAVPSATAGVADSVGFYAKIYILINCPMLLLEQ